MLKEQNRQNLIKSIRKSSNQIHEKKRRFYFNRGVNFIVKDPVPKTVDIERIMDLLRSNLPPSCYDGLRNVYFGQFDILKKRKLTALHYEDNIYVDNRQNDEKDFLDDLVHEFAHRFEENHGEEIYEDGKIVNEFLGKRNRLYDLLKQEGIELNYFDFLNVEYDRDFDMFLYEKVGYKLIENIAPTLFIRAYAATSVREYFATGFESYFLEGAHKIKEISPQLYLKIKTIDGTSNFNIE